jgi:hypothetical protein
MRLNVRPLHTAAAEAGWVSTLVKRYELNLLSAHAVCAFPPLFDIFFHDFTSRLCATSIPLSAARAAPLRMASVWSTQPFGEQKMPHTFETPSAV